MEYKMEELVIIVGKLAEKYNAHESTSITYEKAEQLMGAVLYCIHEAEQFEQNTVVSAENISAQRMYEIGKSHVQEKTKKALNLYNEVLQRFSFYENRCLYDTFVKGIPEFFKWYDSQFEPQNTILTLDYPILKDISRYTGIDKIFEFIVCIHLEQRFLKLFPKEYVINVLSKNGRCYKDIIGNICEIVLESVIGHILAGKPLSEPDLEQADYLQIEDIVMQADDSEINKQLKSGAKAFIYEYYEDCHELWEYLEKSIDNIAIRLKNGAENGSLHRIF